MVKDDSLSLTLKWYLRTGITINPKFSKSFEQDFRINGLKYSLKYLQRKIFDYVASQHNWVHNLILMNMIPR